MPAVDKKLSTKLVANIEEFEGGLNEAEKKLQRFERFVQNEQRKTAQAAEKQEFTKALAPQTGAAGAFGEKGLAGSLELASPRVAGMIAQFGELSAAAGPVGIVVAVVAAEFAALAAVGYGVVSFLRSSWEEMAPLIVHTGQLAKITNSTTESLVGLHLAASELGISGEIMDTAVERLQRKLGEAKLKGGEAAAGFENLGFSMEDVSSLAKGRGSAALEAVADKLHAIQDPSLRAAEAEEIFGRQWREIAPAIEGGAAGMRQAAKDANELGLSFSALDATQVQMASASAIKLEKAWEGVKTQVAIDLAPYVEAVADAALDFLHNMGGVKVMVGAVADVTEEYGGVAADAFQVAWHEAEALYHMLVAGKDVLTGDLVDAAKEYGKAIAVAISPIDAGDKVRDAVEKVRKAARDAAAEKPPGAAPDFLSKEQLTEQIKEAGDTGGHNIFDTYAASMRELNKLADAGKIKFGDMAAESHKLATGLQEAENSMAKGMLEKTRTPLEKFREEMSNLDRLLADQKISQDTYNRAAGQDTLDLLKSAGSQQIQAPRGLEAGTGEAYSAILKATRPEQTLQERMAKIQAQSEQHLALLARIAEQQAKSGGGPKFVIKGK